MSLTQDLAALLPELPDGHDEFAIVISLRRPDPSGDDPQINVPDLIRAAHDFLPRLATAVGVDVSDLLIVSGKHDVETDEHNPVQSGSDVLALDPDNLG